MLSILVWVKFIDGLLYTINLLHIGSILLARAFPTRPYPNIHASDSNRLFSLSCINFSIEPSAVIMALINVKV